MNQLFREKANGIFQATAEPTSIDFEKGSYIYFPVKPTKNIKSALSVTREILTVITDFTDLQARTIALVKNLLSKYHGRFEQSLTIIIHKDSRGSSKLKIWGAENGITIIQINYFELESNDIRSIINEELYSQDPFDITGPVSKETEFFGRREEAIAFARKIQTGNISSLLGIRKTGKTSLINRVTDECEQKHNDSIIFIDCSRDDIWSLDSNKLLKTLYINIKDTSNHKNKYNLIKSTRDYQPITIEDFITIVDQFDSHIILIFDEFDYISPSSPTNSATWKVQFNNFWRQMRVIFQETRRRKSNFSIVLCGVSSKWFRVSEIESVENAAVALIPDEYIRPLQEGAVVSMVKKLGNRCGLTFDNESLNLIYKETSGIPSWTRKFCSYINRRVALNAKPLRVNLSFATQMLKDYVAREGISYSKVAIEHLFVVYPEIKLALIKFEKDSNSINPNERLLLESYGIIDSNNAYSGSMMQETVKFCLVSSQPEIVTNSEASTDATVEWADEIAEIAKRQNIIEKELRRMILELIKADVRINKTTETTKDRLLKCLESSRKQSLSNNLPDDILNSTYWLELINIIKKEWKIMENYFGDQGILVRNMEFLNNRSYAHAKDLEALELAVTKSALTHLESIILKYHND